MEERTVQRGAADLRPLQEIERDRFEADQSRGEREMRLREQELSLRRDVWRRTRWLALPAGMALIAGFLLLAGACWNTWAGAYNEWAGGAARQRLERQRLEFDMLGAALSVRDPEQRARNLTFLIEAGLVKEAAPAVQALLQSPPETLPYLPHTEGPAEVRSPLQAAAPARPSPTDVEVEEQPVRPARPAQPRGPLGPHDPPRVTSGRRRSASSRSAATTGARWTGATTTTRRTPSRASSGNRG
jgi:hypothetical protein